MQRSVSDIVLIIASTLGAFSAMPLHAQTSQRPATQGQKPAAPQRPAAPTAKPPATTAKPPASATAKPAEPAPPPKPVVQDVRMKTVYSTGGQKTESVTYRKGLRERFEFGDVIVLKQPDLKRTVQIMRAANTYMVVAEGAPLGPPMPAAAPNAPPQTPGVVTMTTTIVDTGERKTMFGLQARHAKVTIDKHPAGPACDSTKQHIETDGWYVDLPVPAQATQGPLQEPPATGCIDQVKAAVNGDANVLGFPVSYATTILGDDGKPNAVAMEISELEITNLDAALFEIPPGMTGAGDLRALTQAVSNADEVRLAEQLAPSAPPVQRTPGVVLVGVADVANKTTQQIDTRALRGRLVSELAELKLNAAPLAGGQADLAQAAGAHGYDYVLVAEITDLKVSKGGGIGGLIKAATKVGAGGPASDPTEAAVTIRLVQPDGKARYTTTSKGKDGGGGLDLKSGLGVAKFAGGMYMNMMTGKLLMNALNQSMTGKLGGMGMLGNPALLNMQTQGLGMKGGMQGGLGIDPTAGAASFLMRQSLASNALTSGLAGQGPSFDAALGDALKNAAKSVSDNLKKK